MARFKSLFILLMLSMQFVLAQTADKVLIPNESSVHTDPLPSTYSQEVKFQLKWNGDIGVPAFGAPGIGTYSTNMTVASWSDGSANKHHQLNFNEQGLYWRKGLPGSSWESWQRLVNADANGNVGIGTTSPLGQLHLASDQNHEFRMTRANGTYGFRIVRDATGGYFNFQIGNNSNTWETKIKIGEGEGVNTKLLLNPDGGNVGVGTNTPENKIQIGPNPQGWNGNDLVISNTINGNVNWTQLLISNALDHSMLYGSSDIAIRPGFGKWSVYSKASNAYVGIGHNAPTSMLHVVQSSNTDWASMILNGGGAGKGLLVKSGSGDGETAPILQLEDNLGAKRFLVRSDGNVGIGTASPDAKLAVNGTVHAKEVKVDLNITGPDYVFEKDYNLMSLEEIKAYIDKHKHLPEVPSAKEMETNGVNLSEMNMILLKKVEELTLHNIKLNEELESYRNQNENVLKLISCLEEQMAELKRKK